MPDVSSRLTFVAAPRPNPVSSAGTIFEYAIGSDTAPAGSVDVQLRVFDLQGRAVRTILRPAEAVGRYRVQWNGTDDGGTRVAPGVYQMQFSAGAVRQSRMLVVLR